MKKERIWTVVMLGAVAAIIVLVMLIEFIDSPGREPDQGIYRNTSAVTETQSRYKDEDGSDATYYGYRELEEKKKAPADPGESEAEEAWEENSLKTALKTYDDKVNWGVKSATNEVQTKLFTAGVEAMGGDVSGAVGDMTESITDYLGDLYGAIMP